MSDVLAFVRALARGPKRVGAVMPSSSALAKVMVDAAAVEPGDVVVELGAGTGPFTRELRARHPDNPLLVLEPDPQLAALCRRNVPGAEVVEAYAQELPRLLAERGHAAANRVVSGLPFAVWEPALQREVLDAVVGSLAPGGRFVTFTYVQSPWLSSGRRARHLLEGRFAGVARTAVVWSNVPPAFAYVADVAPIA